jgi:DNA-binding MarR family transcriptional regulator
METRMPAGSKSRRPEPATPAARADAERNNRMLFRLFRTSNLMTRRNTVWLGRLGITAEQCSVLSTLSRPQSAAGMTVNELCEYLMVSRQGLSGVLQRLDRLGLTRRAAQAGDRRVRRVELTAKGRACVARIMPLMSAFSALALTGFSAAEVGLFMQFADRLKQNLLPAPAAPVRRPAARSAAAGLRAKPAADAAAA